jgi:hypothetical protein
MATENDRDKFVRLANARVNKALKCITLIGNLSNRANYKYEKSDIDKIFRALNNELKICRHRFESGDAEREGGFNLEE